MIRGFVILFFLNVLPFDLFSQVISIKEIQGEGDISPYNNQEVTVKGTVTGTYSEGYFIRENSSERAGLYIYDPGRNPLPSIGDTLSLIGIITEYYQWTEMKNLTSYEIISTGNPTPEPVSLATGDINEDWESCLVRVENAICTNTDLGYGEWEINDESGKLVVNDLGYSFQPEQDQVYEITGPVSFSYGAFKIEPRFEEDIIIQAPVYFTSDLRTMEIERNSITLEWQTNVESSTEIQWGFTPYLEEDHLIETGDSINHQITIDNLQPSDLIYVRAFSVLNSDTASSGIKTFITRSESTGEMRVSFNRTYTKPTFTDEEDLFTNNLMDTLIRYINLAETSLDLALYDFTTHATSVTDFENQIIPAINDASSRGVNIRMITDKDVASAIKEYGIDFPLLEADHDGIMHHKFIIVDHSSISNSWVISGSTNPNYNNLILDFNNLIAIQDKSLAKAYLIEFNEMWGSETLNPDLAKARWGNQKTDNSPHEFIIGGKKTELYFSPSDQTTANLTRYLKEAENSIDFAIMAFTQNVLGNAIISAKDSGVEVKGIIDYVEFSGSEFNYLLDNGIDVLDYQNPDGSGWPDGPTLHHKFTVIDGKDSLAKVITGSHNWTASAENNNDENTLIIHDKEIAGLFLREFNRIRDWLLNPPVKPLCRNDVYEVSSDEENQLNVTENDDIIGEFDLLITREPDFGDLSISQENILTYSPSIDFTGEYDTIKYSVIIKDYPEFQDSATVIINRNLNALVSGRNIDTKLRVYPNPAEDFINIYFNSEVAQPIRVELRDIKGKVLMERNNIYNRYPLRIISREIPPGIYFITLITDMGELHEKIVKK